VDACLHVVAAVAVLIGAADGLSGWAVGKGPKVMERQGLVAAAVVVDGMGSAKQNMMLMWSCVKVSCQLEMQEREKRKKKTKSPGTKCYKGRNRKQKKTGKDKKVSIAAQVAKVSHTGHLGFVVGVSRAVE